MDHVSNGPVAPVSNQPSGIVESSAFQAVYKDVQILSASSPSMSGNPSGVVKLSQVNTKIGELQKTMQNLEACQKRADTDLDRGSLQIQHDVINGVLGELESARQALKDGLVGLAPDMRTEGIKPIDTSKLGKEISRLQNANTELAKSKEQAATKAEQGKFQIQADLNQQKIDQYMAAQSDLRSLSVGLNPYEKCSGSQVMAFQYPMKDYKVSGKEGGCTFSSKKCWTPSNIRTDHLGIDITSSDERIYPMAEGTVVAKGKNNDNGNYIVIKHIISGKTVYSFYAHMAEESRLKVGKEVNLETNIGKMGDTGRASGKHLHFSITDKPKIGEYGDLYGYGPDFAGDKTIYEGVIYYNPDYVIKNQKLP